MGYNLSTMAKSTILDTLFPIFCYSCGKEGYWLCEDCLTRIEIVDIQVCPCCENSITEKGILCPNCLANRKSFLSGIIVSVSYENPSVKKLVHNFKYRFISAIADPLAKLMTKALIRNDFSLPDLILPVPLHPRRLRWRGFNQSLLLAKNISKQITPHLELEILEILERKKCNSPQMKIKNYQERLQNVQGIFALKENIDCKKIENKKILLIDDITTTGATLQECARILKTAGAKKVYAVVIARQNFKNSKNQALF